MSEQIDNQPDGMCLDTEESNLYVAHYGMRQVQVVDPSGKIIRRYQGGNLTTSNVAFGGPDMDTLYITGGIKGEGDSEGRLFRDQADGREGAEDFASEEVTMRRNFFSRATQLLGRGYICLNVGSSVRIEVVKTVSHLILFFSFLSVTSSTYGESKRPRPFARPAVVRGASQFVALFC